MSRSLYVSVSVYASCHPDSASDFSNVECYIVDEVIEVDELDEGKIFAAAGKQDK